MYSIESVLESTHVQKRWNSQNEHSDLISEPEPTSSLWGSLWPSKHMWYEIFEATVFCIADSQILLCMALFIYFGVLGGCKTSQYHFQIGVNISLLACSIYLLSLCLIRRYWKSPVAAFIRVLCALTVHGYLAYIFNIRRALGYTAVGGIRGPPADKRDSLLLLKAVCFLDKSHEDVFRPIRESPQLSDLVGGLDEAPLHSVDFVLWCFIFVATALDLFLKFVAALGRSMRKRRNRAAVGRGGKADEGHPWQVHPRTFVAYLLLLWAMCTVVVGLEISALLKSREWMRKSGWMAQQNADEQEVRTFGQVAALVAMVAVAIAMSDKVTHNSEMLEK